MSLYSLSPQADLPDELLVDVENAHNVLASGKDLQAVETDLDIAQVRASMEGMVFTSGFWVTYLSFREGWWSS